MRAPALGPPAGPARLGGGAAAPRRRAGAARRARPRRPPPPRAEADGGGLPPRFSFTVDSPVLADSSDLLEVPDLRSRLTPRPSPFVATNNYGGGFVSDDDRVALTALRFGSHRSAGATCQVDFDGAGYDSSLEVDDACVPLPPWAVRAGARETIYFNPSDARVAIVTCGGLCPGLNDVVQGIVNKATDYGVREGNVWGIRYGFKGFYDKAAPPVPLTKRSVEGVHLEGGTLLGTSRGGADVRRIVKTIDLWGIDMLFVVGGNGGNAGAAAIQAALAEAGIVCAVVGVPKSIDNDILLIDRCFGFDTAVEEAQRALLSAKVEAASAYRGVGVVKLMGRQSGFIALNASMASGLVDVCLIPEVPFALHGERGLLAYLESVLAARGHAVVCVAEGAGQDLLAAERAAAAGSGSGSSGGGGGGGRATDASGNPVLDDIGPWLTAAVKRHLPDVTPKYIDPSYLIRAVPTTSGDRIYCKILAHNAVHAAFAGFTGVVPGLVNTHYVYLPIPMVIQAPRLVNPRGKQWNRLRAAIGQPDLSPGQPAGPAYAHGPRSFSE